MPIQIEKGFTKKSFNPSPGTALAEVLAEACSHFKVDSSRHVLRHKKKELDLTLPVRLANLPAGAGIELFELSEEEAKKRVVVVALQQASGSRAQAEFGSGSTLYDLLVKFEDLCSARLVSGTEEKQEVVRISFMNRNIDGVENLKKTTLIKLGVVSGSVLFKHSIMGGETGTAMEAPAAPAAASPPVAAVPKAESKESETSAKDGSPDSEKQIPMDVAQESRDKQASSAEAGKEEADDQMQVDAEGPQERSWSVGRPNQEQSDPSILDVDDDMFEFTAADYHRIQQEKEKKDKSNILKTRKLRQQEKEAALSKYKHVPIRVVFPDQTWIQARFSAMETLSAVYTFVRETLTTPERSFYLYITPPPTKLQDSSNTVLKYTQLLPAAKVFFSWNEAPAQEGPFMTYKYIEAIEEGEKLAAQEGAQKRKISEEEVAEKEKKSDEVDQAKDPEKKSSRGGGQALGSAAADSGDSPESTADMGSAARAAEARAQPKSTRPKWFKMK